MEMKRTLILVFFFLILGLSLKPVFAAPNPILLASEKIVLKYLDCVLMKKIIFCTLLGEKEEVGKGCME